MKTKVEKSVRHFEGGDGPLAKMDALANDGWCVVLKRLPPGRAWTIEGSRSEYDAPCADRQVGSDQWCCECSDMDMRPGHKYRNMVDGLGWTANEAVERAFERVREDKERARKATP